MIKIIAIGKKHESWIQDGLERYQKRLKKPFEVEWVLLPHSSKDGMEARKIESEAVLSRLHDDDYVVLLDETGAILDSPALSLQLKQQLDRSRHIIFIIGGAYGVNEALKTRADLIWSLSKLVFPHQLVRLLLIEQLYRSQEIARGGNYHHI